MSEEQATELSVQLWTVREQLSHDSEATLRALGAIGYRQIELMDVCGTRDLLPVVRDLGLVVRSAFFSSMSPV